MMQRLMYVVCALVLTSATLSFAGLAPERMNYQATLVDGAGDPVTTEVNVTFRIYNSAVAKAMLWEEARTFTPDTNGMFSIILGEVTPLNEAAFVAADTWLGITVAGDSELSPRTQLTSSPYSFRVETVDQADAGTIKGPLTLAPSEGGSGDDAAMYIQNSTGENSISMGVAADQPQLIVKGPGGDDIVILTQSGVELLDNSAKALSPRVALSKEEGLVVLSSTNPADTVIHIHLSAGSGLPRIELRDPSTGMSTVMNTGEDAVAVYDENENLQATFGLDPTGGGAATFYDGSSKTKALSTKTMEMNKDGYHVFDTDGVTDLLTLHANGNIEGKRSIAVGEGCTATGDWSTVFGFGNTASGDSSTVSGGYSNTAAGRLSTISGGHGNNIGESGNHATIGGGISNTADSGGGTVGGGQGNTAGAPGATVGGGGINVAARQGSTIAGGSNNSVTAINGAICGGSNNTVVGIHGSVVGGFNNHASGNSGILGGTYQYIDTGAGNSAILSGYYCRVMGEYSVVAGGWALAKHRDCFVWNGLTRGNPEDSVWTSVAEQTVLAAGNGIYLTNSPGEAVYDATKLITTSTGASLTTGGVWTDAPKARGEVGPVDGIKVLGMLEELPVNEWRSTEDESVRHISPLPKDFHAVTGLGNNDGSISSGDMAGVALVAVKQLYKMVQEQQVLAQELKAKDQQIESLEMRLTQMEAMMEIILAKRDVSGDDNTTLASNR